MRNKVVLFYPPHGGPPLGAPVCLLALASPLLEAGFRVSLIDGNVKFTNVNRNKKKINVLPAESK